MDNYKPYTVDEQKNQIILVLDNDETEIILPLEWGVCPICQGNGSHVNSTIDSHGIGQEEFDADPDFAESYFSGQYDVPCNECKGKRVVPTSKDARFVKAVQEAEDDDYRCKQEAASERRFGC
jgi:RecJ-like exonuclease